MRTGDLEQGTPHHPRGGTRKNSVCGGRVQIKLSKVRVGWRRIARRRGNYRPNGKKRATGTNSGIHARLKRPRNEC